MFRSSLRIRFVGAVLALVVLICGGFFVAFYKFVEVLEAELVETAVMREVHELADVVSEGQSGPLPHSFGMRGFIWESGSSPPSAVPPEMAKWPTDTFARVRVEGREFFAGREDVGTRSVGVMLDVTQIEAVEAKLAGVASVVIAAAMLSAVCVGYLLSWLVLNPVALLARQVSTLQPGNRRLDLRDRFGDRDIGMIAASVDQYQQRIEDFVRRERDFTDDAGHELRTPLTVILGAMPLLKEDSAHDADSHARVMRVERAATQMSAQIEALLFLAREDGGQCRQPCAMSEVVESLVDQWRDVATSKGLEIRAAIQDSPMVLAPPGMAASVIGNVLANAVRHTPRGEVRVTVCSDRVRVEDTGPGIRPDEQAQIFERHYRGIGSGGSGIGLYLVRRICDRIGWRIQIASRAAGGTIFEIIFSAEGGRALSPQ